MNEVLTSRTGIPISLAVVYLEIGRRLEKPVHGVGLPGHFVVKFDDGAYRTFVDAFHGGRLLDSEGCVRLAKEVAGMDVAGDLTLLEPVDVRHMVLRMLNNLKGIYYTRKQWKKLLRIFDVLIEADPTAAEEHKQRGICQLQLEQGRLAKADFERYLELRPEAEDREQVKQQIQMIQRVIASWN